MSNLSLYGFPIERTTPLSERHRPGKYPWRTLQVGESFAAQPGVKPQSMYNQSNLAAKRTGFRFSVQQVDGEIRIRRVS
jgi:hypothetical protein